MDWSARRQVESGYFAEDNVTHFNGFAMVLRQSWQMQIGGDCLVERRALEAIGWGGSKPSRDSACTGSPTLTRGGVKPWGTPRNGGSLLRGRAGLV